MIRTNDKWDTNVTYTFTLWPFVCRWNISCNLGGLKELTVTFFSKHPSDFLLFYPWNVGSCSISLKRSWNSGNRGQLYHGMKIKRSALVKLMYIIIASSYIASLQWSYVFFNAISLTFLLLICIDICGATPSHVGRMTFLGEHLRGGGRNNGKQCGKIGQGLFSR